jgi:3-oxoadipate enol-lactonase
MEFLKEKDGFRLYYEDNSSGGNLPAILFLHGAGGNHLSWWQQVPAFVREYRCITVDQRGFGKSLDVPDGPGPKAFTSDTLALLDHLGLDRVAIVAQSMGGWAAVGAAVQQPRRFWAIVLANTHGGLTDPEIATLNQNLQSARAEGPTVLWQGASFNKGALGVTFQKRDPTRTFLYAQFQGLNEPLINKVRNSLDSMNTLVERYNAWGIPTLFITSEEDILTRPKLLELLQSKVPSSRLLYIPKAGHSVYFEQPELFNREVKAFLSSHALGPC